MLLFYIIIMYAQRGIHFYFKLVCFGSLILYTGVVSLSPRLGSQLGGTFVTVSGPCFEPTDTVECSFGAVATPGHYMNRESVACVSPAMNAIGRVEMTLVVTSANGDITFQKSALFYSSKFNSCV